jgi:hypothetical protein
LKIVKLWVKSETDERGYLAMNRTVYNFVCENDPNETTNGLNYTMNIEKIKADGVREMLNRTECFT